MPVFEVIDSVPYTPKRRPASPFYSDPAMTGGDGTGVDGVGLQPQPRILMADTYQPVFDHQERTDKNIEAPFEIYQDKHVYEAVYEELKPVDPATSRIPPLANGNEKPPLPAKNRPMLEQPHRKPLGERSNNNWTLSSRCGDKYFADGFAEKPKVFGWSKLRKSGRKYTVHEPVNIKQNDTSKNSSRFSFWKLPSANTSNSSLSSLLFSSNNKAKSGDSPSHNDEAVVVARNASSRVAEEKCTFSPFLLLLTLKNSR